MMIPDYQSTMLPVLKRLGDRQEHKFRELIEDLSKEFKVTDEERKELLPSGTQPIFDNRVGWARTYLKKAGLIESPKRAITIITQLGLDVLEKKPEMINVAFLKQFPAFIEFQTLKRDETEGVYNETTIQTPEENLDSIYVELRKSLAHDILNQVISMTPAFFEKLVVELLVKMGYGGSLKDAGKAIGKSGDEGIDGTIKEDKLGLDIIYIQAKRWQIGNSVGRPEIQKFVGALAGQGAKKGIFITTSSFTKDAIEYSPKNETKIVLIDGTQLAQLMIDYNIGVSTLKTYEIKRVDNDFFEDE
ncbi:MAG: restriction endonuclease [Bacteroidales bacterium]|nr:restriction endonuclease [Bacteroidales bacterium]